MLQDLISLTFLFDTYVWCFNKSKFIHLSIVVFGLEIDGKFKIENKLGLRKNTSFGFKEESEWNIESVYKDDCYQIIVYVFQLYFSLGTYVTHPTGFKPLSKFSGTLASSQASFITVSLTVKPVESPPETCKIAKREIHFHLTYFNKMIILIHLEFNQKIERKEELTKLSHFPGHVGFEMDLFCIHTHKPFSGSITYPFISTPYCRSPNMPENVQKYK